MGELLPEMLIGTATLWALSTIGGTGGGWIAGVPPKMLALLVLPAIAALLLRLKLVQIGSTIGGAVVGFSAAWLAIRIIF